MHRPLVAGAGFGLLFGAFFASSFFGWAFGADLVATGLVLLTLVAAGRRRLARWALARRENVDRAVGGFRIRRLLGVSGND
ncbi:MAG: hypothetical protein ACYC2H_09865 [Thermoplasmatota archaeon]